MRFSVRSLLMVTLVVAVYFAISQSAGYLVGLGIVVCVGVLVSAMFAARSVRTRPVRVIRWLLILTSIAGVWFLAVDRTWLVDSCPVCGLDHNSYQHRIIGIPVSTITVDDHTAISSCLTALNRPCEHPGQLRWQKYRYWGLIYSWPRGSYGTTIAAALEPDEMAKLRALGVADPKLAEEFHRKFVVERDLVWARKFFETHFPEWYESEE